MRCLRVIACLLALGLPVFGQAVNVTANKLKVETPSGSCSAGSVRLTAAGVLWRCVSNTWTALSTSLVVGTTAISGGTSGRVLFDNAGVVGEDADLSFATDTLTATKIVASTNFTIGAGSAITSSGAGGAIGTAAFKSTGTSGNTVPLLDGANTFSAAQVVSSNSASCFSVGANGDTNPVLRAKCNTASVATGIEVQGAAAGSGVTLQAISSGSNEDIKLAPKGTGVVQVSGKVALEAAGAFISLGNIGQPVTLSALWSTNVVTGAFFTNNRAYPINWGADVGLVSPAAGALRVSNASTGTGTLGFALPALSKTADYTVLDTDTGSALDNVGAAGTVIFTTPTPARGLNNRYCRVADQTVRVDVGGSVTIQIGASATTAGGDVTLDAVGSCITIWAVSATQWFGHLSGAATFN